MPRFRTRTENPSGPREANSLPTSSSAKLLDTSGTPVQSSTNGFAGSAFRRFSHFVRSCRPAGLDPNPVDSSRSLSTMASPVSVSYMDSMMSTGSCGSPEKPSACQSARVAEFTTAS